MTQTITAVGPDGREHVFPAGTRQEVIDRVMRQTYGQPSREAAGHAAVAAADRRGQRGFFERQWDNLRDGYQHSGVGNILRSANPGDDGFFNPKDLLKVREGSPVDWALDRTVGTEREWFAGDSASPGVGEVLTGQAMKGTPRALREDARRADYDAKAAADPIRNPADFAAFMSGQILGSAISPENWLGGGRALTMGRSLGGRLAFRAAEQGVIAGAADIGLQTSDIGAGIEDHYRPTQTLMSMGFGAIIGGALEPFGKPAEVRAAPALHVGDDLMAPALSMSEIAPTPPRVDLPEGATVIRRVEGGPLPGDVWSPEQNAWLHRVDGPTTEASGKPVEIPKASDGSVPPETPEGPSRASAESSEGLPATRAPEQPTGDGTNGWTDVDWGARKSPERVAAAMRHLEGLRKFIRPEAVKAFVKALDDGIPGAEEGVHINERWVDWQEMGGDPEGILGFTNAISDIFKDVYDKAGDARQGWDKTAEIAKQFGYTLSDVIKTHADITGEGGITARAGALRDASLASDKAFYDQLKSTTAAMQKGDMTGVGALAESLHRTLIMGAMDAGASSEIARALQYRQRLGKPKFPRNDLQAAVDEINDILNKGGDLDEAGLSKVMDELTRSYEKGGSAGMRQAVKQMRELGFWDYVNYYATASLLSAPTTHIRNAFGTPIHALFQIGERYIAAGVGAGRRAVGLGSAERVTFREALAYSSGLTQAWTEGLTLGGKAFLRGAPVAEQRSSVMANEMAAQVPFAFSPQRFAEWKAKPLSPKTWADLVGVGVFEFQRTLGFRTSVAFDELYKTLGRRMEVNALAYREASYRAAIAGKDADKVFASTLTAMQSEPTAAAFKEAKGFFADTGKDASGVYEAGSKAEEMALILRSIDHRQMAVDHAQLLAFQNSGPIVEKWDRALKAVPIIKSLWVNFVRTPVAILKAGIVDRNPLVAGTATALEMTTRSGRIKHKALFDAAFAEEQALARGGAEADLAVARQAMGAAVLSGLWMWWANGDITGKQTEQERKGGPLDYSFRIPGTQKWVQYTGMSPFGEMIGLVADTAAGLRRVDADDASMSAVIGALATAVRNNVVNKSFLKGLGDFMDMMTGGQYGAPTGEDAGEGVGKAVLEAVIPRAIPGGALFRRIAQDTDPVIRDARSFNEMILAALPGLSESVAARRDFMGRPLVRQPGERGVLQAFNTSGPTKDPLERELGSLASILGEGFQIGMSPRKINGEDITPTEYSRLLEVQGQLLQIHGRNMEETLRETIKSPEYRSADPEYRADQLKRTVTRFRERANKAVKDPRSEFFMAETARRTGARRLEVETRRRGWTESQAMSRGRSYGLQPDDQEVSELRTALFPEE